MSKFQVKNFFIRKGIILLFLLILGGIFLPFILKAENEDISIYLDSETVEKGYTIDKPDGKMRLAVFPNVLDRPADISLRTKSPQGFSLPEDLTLISDIFEFDIKTDPIKIFAKEVIIVLKYNSDNQLTKKIYFYDGNQDKWRPLYSQTNYDDKWVRAYTHLPYSIVAVFESDDSREGYATWYRSSLYPYGCASNDYPLETKLKVTSLENGKSVVCQVKSGGPYDGNNRIIDLSLTAFEAIAPPWQGLAKVHIEPVDEATHLTSTNQESSPAIQGVATPSLSAPVAMIYEAEGRKVIYEKNSHLKRSIASITKLMTTIVFLETNPDFEKVVTIEDSDLPRPEAGVRIAVYPEDQIKVKDLFNAMITGSANNATLALVRSTGLSQEEFVASMNKKAKDLDMMSTNFVEPTGLGVGNISTTTDIALLINYIMNRPSVRQASIQGSYTYSILNKEERTIRNPLYIYDYNNQLSGLPIVAAKTGFINEAGYCLATKVRHSTGQEFVAVVLGSPTRYTRISDIKNLIEYGLKVFK